MMRVQRFQSPLGISKILFCGIVLCTNLLWGRFYVGVEGGYLRDKNVYDYIDKSKIDPQANWTKNFIGNGGIANIILGTEHFYGSQYFGLRWGIFGGYGFSQSKDNFEEWGKVNLNVFSAGTNFDLFFNFYVDEKTMSGVFLGFEYDFLLLKPSKEVKLGEEATPPVLLKDVYVSNKTFANDIVARVGFSTLISKHHRFEIMAKIPFIIQENSKSVVLEWNNITADDRTYTYAYEYIQALIGYKYVF